MPKPEGTLALVSSHGCHLSPEGSFQQLSLPRVIKICLCYCLRVYIPGFHTWHLFYNVHLYSTNHGVG